jgi:hypothetical protein
VFPAILRERYWEDRRAGVMYEVPYMGLRAMDFW